MKTNHKTFGIEIELGNRSLVRPLEEGWTTVHDASIVKRAEHQSTAIGAVPLQENLPYGSPPQHSFGTELVSPILHNVESVFAQLKTLKKLGINSEDSDCAIHVHVSAPPGMWLKTAFIYAVEFQPLFYLAGTFGGVQRGIYKNFQYQRPLINPPIVKATLRKNSTSSLKEMPIFDYKQIGKVKTLKDFEDFITNIGSRRDSYPPAKYCVVNFHSPFRRSTLEIRGFNLTLNYRQIKAAINLSREFVFFTMRSHYQGNVRETVDEMPLSDLADKDRARHSLEILAKSGRFLDTEDVSVIHSAINMAEPFSVPENLLFHLRRHRRGDNSYVYCFSGDFTHFRPEEAESVREPYTERPGDKSYVFKEKLY